jgi:hypothetical protein
MIPSDTTDLIARARVGDAAALERLLQHDRAPDDWSARPAGVGARRSAARASLLRGACDEILRGLGRSGARDRDRLAGWIRAIARRTLRDVARGGGGAPIEPEAPLPAARAKRGARLREALRSLPGEVRAIVRVRAEERLSFAEIARRAGLSETAVRRTYHRALAQLSRRACAASPTTSTR